MTVRGTYLVGLFPPSPALLKVGMGVMKQRLPAGDREPILRSYVQELTALQEELKVPFYTDGNIRFPDLFRPVARALSGVSLPAEGMTGMSPFPRQNYYYAKPRIHGPLEAADPAPLKAAISPDVPRPRKLTLPGPYTFVAAADNRSYTRLDAAMADYARALASLLPSLDAAVDLFELDESLLVHHAGLGKAGLEILAAEDRCLGLLADALQGQLAVNLAYGDSAAVTLHEPAAIWQVNALETDPAALRLPPGDLALGVADNLLPARLQVEEPALLAQRAVPFLDDAAAAGRDMYLVPNAPLVNAPYATAAAKMQALAQAAVLLEGA